MDALPAVLSVFSLIPALGKGVVSALVTLVSQLLWVGKSMSAYTMAASVGIGRVAVMPFSFIWAVIFLILSPVFYTVAYTFAPFWYMLNIVPKLEPLYIYFGSAAFVGITAGIAVKLTAHVFVSVLRLDRTSEEVDKEASRSRRLETQQQLARRDSNATSSSMQSTATTAAGAPGYYNNNNTNRTNIKREREENDFVLSGAAGLPSAHRDEKDIDWQVIERIERRPYSEHLSKMPLLQSIILEEDEDEEGSSGGY